MVEQKSVNSVEEPTVVIEAQANWLSVNLKEIWHYRELLFFLSWRDVKVRYRQTALGATWAILQPVLTMIIFTLVFGNFGKLPSEGIPYAVFTYAALLPWQLFANAVTNSSNSLVGNQNLITKVYFPRILIPLASILSSLVDFFFAFLVLLALMIFYKLPITGRVLFLPLIVLLVLIASFAVSLWLAALNVQYRDVRYAAPFFVQFWMYATPVAYSITIIPERWRGIYAAVNPMTGVVESFRWALLNSNNISPWLFLVSIIILTFILIGGFLYFHSMEDVFADII